MSLRRFLIRNRRHLRSPLKVGLALLVGVGVYWLFSRSVSSSIHRRAVSEDVDAAAQVQTDLLNPVVANVFRSMLVEHQRRQRELRQRQAALLTHPELDDRHARWPPIDATAAPAEPEVVIVGGRKTADKDYWVGHRQQPRAIPGTDSVISVNTTIERRGSANSKKKVGDSSDYLRLLRALMFRSRPPDANYNINVSLSDVTPLDRDVPDGRQKACRKLQHDVSALPDVSIIVPFYNEPLTMLLRTLHSVLDRTPSVLLREVILVDDASSATDLGVPLEKYLTLVPKVLLLRNAKRLGLIRTRQLGSRLARGKVLVFLDAHTEVNTDWLPPLLEEIVKNRKTIVQPVIDNIHPDNLQYESARMGTFVRSIFTWDLRLVWAKLPQHEQALRESHWSPFRAPVLVGCAVAVDRNYYDSIGGFDPEMNIWGGENFEVPFRVWLCGGQVLTVPCSRVGHTFRRLPYLVGNTPEQIERNLLRTAELWMGPYKRFVYGAIPNEYSLNDSDYQSIKERKTQLDKLGLQCRHDFDWLLRTLMPEVPLPPERVGLFGEVGNFQWTSCLAVIDENSGALDLTMNCYMARMLPENYFRMDSESRLVHVASGRCVRYDERSNLLLVSAKCDHDEDTTSGKVARWDFRRTRPRAGQLVLTSGMTRRTRGEMCLTQTGDIPLGNRLLHMRGCKDTWTAQLWMWSYDFNLDRIRDHSDR